MGLEKSAEAGLERILQGANWDMQDIINAIPGGVAIYRVSDIFETLYVSDGVPEMIGYTAEEYRERIRRDAREMIFREDLSLVKAKVREAIDSRETVQFEFRVQHRNGSVVWVRVLIRWIGEEEGLPLLHCAFHNISDIRIAQQEIDHLVNLIPGGIASYLAEDGELKRIYFSDGMARLLGYTREEFEEQDKGKIKENVFEEDRERVKAALTEALHSGEVLDIVYRTKHKNGDLIWTHLNGRRIGPAGRRMLFYAVFTGMSEETRLLQDIANEVVDGIYVIDRENYQLLYVNESRKLFATDPEAVGKKCYAALHGKDAPCEFCPLTKYPPDGSERSLAVDGTDRIYTVRFRKANWGGRPAYIQYIRDTTDEAFTQRERNRLEQYFQTMVKNLPGGVAVVRCEKNGKMVPEFMSPGFVDMMDMTTEEAWALYQTDAMTGVHPDDRESVMAEMALCLAGKKKRCEIVYRLQKGGGGYIWVKNTLTLLQEEDGVSRVYAIYRDVTKEREEQEAVRRRYNELLVQHYRTSDPNVLLSGHCNITKNRIMEVQDHTNSQVLERFGRVREEFFEGLSLLIPDEEERRIFRETYLAEGALKAFESKDTEKVQECFIQLPGEKQGRYVEIRMNMIATPDSGDVTGILTVTDITERTISEQILYQFSAAGYDYVVDLDLVKDAYKVLVCNMDTGCIPPQWGCYSEWCDHVCREQVVPKDQENYRRELETAYMWKRVNEEGSYRFAFSIREGDGDIRTKNMTVSAIDLRLGRVCLMRSDITDSIREQQGLLNMVAYTFELAGFIDLQSRSFTMYTREGVLNNLPPRYYPDYQEESAKFARLYETEENPGEAEEKFCMETMLEHLAEKPGGYEFVLPFRGAKENRYKQINVLWGDANHRTICLVRADVTDVLAAERETKRSLENALALAKEASQAKSRFLSSMSHDIRTPMNAIMGMTELAVAHLDDRDRVEDCLKKIMVSSRHLLSLVNDVLDMSKIERSEISLNRMKISIGQMLEQICSMMEPQAEAAGLTFTLGKKGIQHEYFYGDYLRISQILVNILSNAIKFTPEGGRVDFLAEEREPEQPAGTVRYRITVRDTGVGMSEEFRRRMFEPFTRDDRVQMVEGTGLGLSIIKGLLDLMGGRLSVRSEVGKGTEFQIELELEAVSEENIMKKKEDGASPGRDSKKRLAGRRFLIAEDNAINAEILCELLHMSGAETVVEGNGARAADAFRRAEPGRYDAVLMDIQMPVMNGYEAARCIRQMPRPDAAKIPIVAMTANAFKEDVQEAMAAGMNAHVAKPIDVTILMDTLLRVLGEGGL
jgi:PAS domain S-box-containing protein